MNVFMVYAHQDIKSFGAALHARTLSFLEKRGDHVVVSDLYASGFHATPEKWDFKTSGGVHRDYVMEQKRAASRGLEGFAEDIQQDIQRLRDCDLIVFEFPIWWSAPPAIIKGWIDKIFALGIVWDGSHRYSEGLMHGKQALVIGCADDAEDLYTPAGIHRASLSQHLYPLLHSTLAHSGIDVLKPYFAYNLMMAGDEERQEKINALEEFLQQQTETPKYLYKH